MQKIILKTFEPEEVAINILKHQLATDKDIVKADIDDAKSTLWLLIDYNKKCIESWKRDLKNNYFDASTYSELINNATRSNVKYFRMLTVLGDYLKNIIGIVSV